MNLLQSLPNYIEKGLISEQIHPENSDIRIYNYTHACQWERAWDEVTTKCRGLIVNVKTGEFLSNPFEKFFNYGEYEVDLPAEQPVITEKYDGSLGILYWLDGKPWIATRGSFTSDQAMWATNWFRKYINENDCDPEITYLFEIIFASNRIVVNYPFEGLVFLCGRHIKTGREHGPEFINRRIPRLKETPFGYGGIKGDDMRYAGRVPNTELEELKKREEKNAEGFVIHFQTTGLRLKVKFDEYVRLHKIITGLSVKGVWEALKDKKDLTEFLKDVPDEFYQWFSDTVDKLKKDYRDVEQVAKADFLAAGFHLSKDATRKEWAEEIKKGMYPSLGFALLDNKDYSQIIWKMVKPRGDKTFKTDIDS